MNKLNKTLAKTALVSLPLFLSSATKQTKQKQEIFKYLQTTPTETEQGRTARRGNNAPSIFDILNQNKQQMGPQESAEVNAEVTVDNLLNESGEFDFESFYYFDDLQLHQYTKDDGKVAVLGAFYFSESGKETGVDLMKPGKYVVYSEIDLIGKKLVLYNVFGSSEGESSKYYGAFDAPGMTVVPLGGGLYELSFGGKIPVANDAENLPQIVSPDLTSEQIKNEILPVKIVMTTTGDDYYDINDDPTGLQVEGSEITISSSYKPLSSGGEIDNDIKNYNIQQQEGKITIVPTDTEKSSLVFEVFDINGEKVSEAKSLGEYTEPLRDGIYMVSIQDPKTKQTMTTKKVFVSSTR